VSSPALADIAAPPRLKIFYVIDSLNVGGAEIQLMSLIRSCLTDGHRVSVSYFTPGVLSEELESLGVRCYRLSRHGLRDPSVVVRLRRLLERLQPDVVHTHLRKSDLAGQLSAAWAGVPARLSTLHNLAPWRRNRAMNLVARSMTSGCHCFIACGDAVRDYSLRVGGLPADRTEVVSNGIDVDRFDPVRFDAQDRAGETIGIVGRLQPAKGHRVFIQAAERLVTVRPEARFVVVGEGPLRAQLMDDVVRAGLEGRFVFTGLVRNVAALVRSFDLFTLSSISEGLPVTLLEAMALERPVVATRVGGIPDVITDGDDGLLVEPSNPNQLAAGWNRLLADPALARQLGKRARRTIVERFDQRIMHRRVKDLYTSLVARAAEKNACAC
jgi:glycosyltransferase involved in cell wall biosynthesis